MTADEIRALEASSIRAFVESCSEYFAGARVLDYGCGKSPYRGIVEQAGGTYVGYDRADFPANVSESDIGPDLMELDGFDTILSTQTIQYVEEPFTMLIAVQQTLREGGVLVLTGPTNWPEVEGDDLFRYTKAGAEKLLRWAGFEIVRLEQRASVAVVPGFELSLGWGAVARA